MAVVKGPLILYIGKDLGYFESVKERLPHLLSGQELRFETYPDCNGAEDVSKNFLKILECEPAIIYLDFSTAASEHNRLALLIRRDNSTSHIPIVGLVEGHKSLPFCRASGVQFVHIKCGEFHDVVYDPCVLAFPNRVKPPAFAKARANKEIELIEDFRVGYLTPDYIHIEGNRSFESGEKIELFVNIASDTLPSRHFVVKETSKRNIYYDYNYACDLNYVYVDPPELKEDEIADGLGAEDEEKKQKMIAEARAKHRESELEFADKLKRAIKKFGAWIEDNRDRSTPKETKILIVDKTLRILKDNKKKLDSFHYTLRLQTFLSEEMSEIERGLPNILAIQFVESSEVIALDARKNQMDLLEYEKEREALVTSLEDEAIKNLSLIFKKINSIEGYTPFIIIFGCTNYTSKSFQETFKYPLVITHGHDFKLEVVTDMAQLYQTKKNEKFEKDTKAKIAELRAKEPLKHSRLNVSDFKEKRYYISKSSELSFAYYSRPIILDSLTESEVSLVTEEELSMSSYRLKSPVKMSVTLVPLPDGKKYESSGGKLKRYRGLIHSVGEAEKKELRRFVNEIFSAPKKEKEIKEKAAFSALNDKKREEREQARAQEEENAQKELAEKLSRNKIG